MRPSDRIISAAGIGTGVACVLTASVCAVLLTVDFADVQRAPSFLSLVAIAMAAAYGAVGGVVVRRHPRGGVGWVLLAIAAGTAVTQAADIAAVRHAPGWRIEAWLQSWTFYLIYPVAFSVLLLVFPTGRPQSKRWMWAVAAVLAAQVPRLVAAAFAPGPVAGHMSGIEILASNPAPSEFQNSAALAALADFAWAFPILGALLAAAALVQRWRSVGGEARMQLKWLAFFGGLAGFALALHFATDAWFAGLPDLGGAAASILLALGLPAAIGVAMFRYRLYEIDLLVNRTLVVALLGAALLGVYFAVVVSLDDILQRHLPWIGSLVGTAAVALLFAPTRRAAQQSVDRLLFGAGADPYDVLARVSQEIAQGNGGRELLDEVAVAVARGLGVRSAVISAVTPDGNLAGSGRSGEPAGKLVSTPLTYRGEDVGTLDLGVAGRWPGVRQPPRLVAELTSQAAVAAHATVQAKQLEDSRARILTARDEERRRLRRDLHDGLGPALAAQTLKAGAAQMALPADPARAVELLRQLEHDGQVTMAEVRRLIHALRPPALDRWGLAGALREAAASLVGPQTNMLLELPDLLPPLAEEIEAATLRIAQEALTNVGRHAHATRCRLSLAVDGDLALTVEDDGVGLDSRSVGVGLSSIRERVIELGGSASIEPGSAGGTVVAVRLPLAGALAR